MNRNQLYTTRYDEYCVFSINQAFPVWRTWIICSVGIDEPCPSELAAGDIGCLITFNYRPYASCPLRAAVAPSSFSRGGAFKGCKLAFFGFFASKIQSISSKVLPFVSTNVK